MAKNATTRTVSETVEYPCAGCGKFVLKGEEASTPYTCEGCLKQGKADVKTKPSNGRGKKKECPITRTQFREEASPLKVTVEGQSLTVDPKEFSTGSLGWYQPGKVKLKVGDEEVWCQMGIQFTIIGSKELPDDEGTEG